VVDLNYNLQLYNIPISKYELFIIDSKGSVIQKKMIDNTTGTSIYNLTLPASIGKGVYVLKLNNKIYTFTHKMIVQ
jgi:hypothetical protein